MLSDITKSLKRILRRDKRTIHNDKWLYWVLVNDLAERYFFDLSKIRIGRYWDSLLAFGFPSLDLVRDIKNRLIELGEL